MRSTTLAIMLSVVSMYAMDVFAQSCSIDTAVYFGNGVNTTQRDAERTARILGRAVVRNLAASEACRYEFKVAYNQSQNLALDLLQVARETLGNEYPTLLMAFILEKVGLDASVFENLLPPGALQAFNERFRSRTAQEMISGTTSVQTTNEHLALYTADLLIKRVILVSHSQGNIYSNLVAARLSSEQPVLYQRFAIVPVASPEYYTAKSLVGHIRFSDDLVIGAVAVARDAFGLPAPLEANDDDSLDIDFWSHFFLEAYFLDESSRQFILDSIRTTVALVSPPPPPALVFDNSGDHQFCQIPPPGEFGGLDCRGQVVGYLPPFFTRPAQQHRTVAVPIDVPAGHTYTLTEAEVPVWELGSPDRTYYVYLTISVGPPDALPGNGTRHLVTSVFPPVKPIDAFWDDPSYPPMHKTYTTGSYVTDPIVVEGGTRIWVQVRTTGEDTSLVWSFAPTGQIGMLAISENDRPFTLVSGGTLPAVRVVLTPQ